MKKLPYILSVILLSILYSCQKNTVVTPVTYEELTTVIHENNYLLIDVRTPEEFEENAIPGAILIPIENENFIERIETFDKNQPIYLYCRTGNRSSRAADLLVQLGFTQVYNYTGGMEEWQEKNRD